MSQQQWKSTKRIIHAAQEVLAEENPMTVRQLFYRLVSRRIIENSLKDYRKISTVMTGAREAGEIPFEWIVDRSRPVYTASVHADPVKSIERFAKHCRVDPWEFQPSYVEVWTEKDAVIGSIEELTEELAVTVRACRGFASATWANGVAELFNSIAKPIYIFYLGDHDPSGRCIETELRERIKRYDGSGFKSQRLAIDA